MHTAPVLSLQFVKSYWVTMRPYLLFVSGITGLAGLSYAPPTRSAETCALFCVFFLSYGFGQALTDCFQTDTDAISSPYRPLVQGIIRKHDVLGASLLFLALCGAILGWFSYLGLSLALLSIGGLATYTFFKRRWWGGPFYNGWIVAVLFLIGYASGLKNTPMIFTEPLLAALICVLFGYANFVLVGYFKDIDADRTTNYHTLPVAAGRDVAAVVSDLFAIVFVITGGAAVLSNLPIGAPLTHVFAAALFGIAATITSVYTQLQLHNVQTDAEAYRAISPSVHTYILMLCAIASANKPEWIPWLAVFYLAFIVTLSARPATSQI